MKKWKSIVSALLAGAMILSSAIISVGAVAFTDVSEHWAWTRGYIPYLVEKNVLNGYEQADGTYTFNPDGTVTRAEFIKMMSETFGLTDTVPVSFSDVADTDWFYPYIAKAAAQGFLLNYGSYMGPNTPLTREEATTLLVRYLDLTDAEQAPASTFADYASINANYQSAVLAAVKAGLIEGYQESNGTYTFRPQNTLTRAEALTILYRAAGGIYNTTVSVKDAGAASTNALITKSGISLYGLDLTGRVIITEGAAGDTVTLSRCTIYGTLELRGATTLILDKCAIYALNVDSDAPSVTVSLANSTNISNLTLDSQAKLAIASGCTVNNMTVNTGAKNVNITGDGNITDITVNASGFISSMVPSEFVIANGLAANFGGKSYSGTSADLESFEAIPYLSESNNRHYLNLTPIASGKVYYYYTNQSYAPTALEFDAIYNSATYRDSFSVQRGRIYAEETFTASSLASYKYVVVQLVTDTRKYAPIRIDNIPTSGTGFSEEPYTDGYQITYTPSVNGQVLYYYSKDGENLSISSFLENYNNASNSLRGSKNATANRTGYIDVSSSAISSYPFVIMVLQNSKDQHYNPVVISAGANGFKEEPAISTVGKISFTPQVSGTLYYYYATTDTSLTPSEFSDIWRTQAGNGSMAITANNRTSVSYDPTYASSHPYMVFCIKDSDGNYRTPFILDINYDTGFSVVPSISSGTEIAFKPAKRGTVYWYFTQSSTVPTTSNFMSSYDGASNARRGTVSVRYTANYQYITFEPSYAAQYPYIAIMLVDTDGKSYQPVLVDVKNDINTGFVIAPYCDTNDEAVYFKTAVSGDVYFYFSRSSVAYNETPAQFLSSYMLNYGMSFPVSASLDYIDYGTIDTDIYPGLMMMFTDNNGVDYYPVYVSLKNGTGSDSSDSVTQSGKGFKVLNVTSSYVQIQAEVSGNIYYRESNDANASPFFSSNGYMNVSPYAPTTIPISGNYTYLSLGIPGYTPLYINLTEDFVPDTETDSDGSNTNGYGFKGHSFNPNGGKLTFTGIATESGTITISASVGGILDSMSTSTAVAAGDVFVITLENFDVNDYFDNVAVQMVGAITFTAQMTSFDGETVYKAYTVKSSVK